jgi:hypothetical protein
MGGSTPLHVHYPQFPVLHSETIIFILSSPRVPCFLEISHKHTLQHAEWRGTERIPLPCAVQSVCERHAQASRLVELALYADDTALVSTFRSPQLLVRYLETYLNTLEL